MNRQQVITVGPDGSISGLQVKPGQGVDLRDFGAANIKRASEIVFSEEAQLWYVQICLGKYSGHKVTKNNCGSTPSGLPWHLSRHCTMIDDGEVLYFKDY